MKTENKLEFSTSGLDNDVLSKGFNFSNEESNRFNEIEKGFITYLWYFERFSAIGEDIIKSIEDRKNTDKPYFEYKGIKLFIYYTDLVECIIHLQNIADMFEDFDNFVRVQCRFYKLNYLFNYKKYDDKTLLKIKRYEH